MASPGRAYAAVRHGTAGLVRALRLPVGPYPAPSSVEHHLRSMVELLGIDCVVDVGAHHGEYAQALRRQVRYRGPIVSIEPSSEAFGALSRAMTGDAAWKGIRGALGAEAGARELTVYAASKLNSLRAPSEAGRAAWGARFAERGRERVDVRTLHDVLSDVLRDGATRPLVKLDTQGSDMEVLRSGGDAVAAIAALQMEVAVRPMYEDVPPFAEALAELRDLGFALTGVFNVARDPTDGLTLLEADCVFRRAAPA